MRCTGCGREFPVREYLDELDEETWEKIARRFKDNPALWAYDLVNEPVCKKPTFKNCLRQPARSLRSTIKN